MLTEKRVRQMYNDAVSTRDRLDRENVTIDPPQVEAQLTINILAMILELDHIQCSTKIP